ncbi:MAG: hypothetical protein PHD07_08840 [Bacteroidales bacterium]|nr:hypothetical protein [Bacteroidales bacterium]
MASSTELQKLWERYQQEGVPQEISIVRYCQMNGVPYKTFERYPSD